jgi:hypothetical protein
MLMLKQLLMALLFCTAPCAPTFERPNLSVVSIEMQHRELAAAVKLGEIIAQF